MCEKSLKIAAAVFVAALAAASLPAASLAAASGPSVASCPDVTTGAAGAAAHQASARAASAGTLEGLPAVCGVSIHQNSAGASVIDISTSRRLPYHVMQLSSPRRLVVDFEGSRNAVPKSAYAAQSPILARVRIGQFRASHPAIVRVVADLTGVPAFEIQRQPWGVQVQLKPRTPAARPQAAPNPFRYRRRPRGVTADATDHSPKSEFPVHQFSDLTASLTAPIIPPQDHLIPIIKVPPQPAPRPASGGMARVYGVSVKPDQDGGTMVDIASSASVPYRVFQLANPTRLVVDLKDAHNASHRGVYPVDSSVLKRVRMAQWMAAAPAVVRVVADLSGSPLFDVHAQKPGVRIELKPRPGPGAPQSLIRNPFEYVHAGPSVRVWKPRSVDSSSAQTFSAPAAGEVSLPDLKALGFLQKPGLGEEAIITDSAGIYFVPQGGAIRNRFRLLKITPTAVEVQDLNTGQSSWLPFTP